jgi:glycosyltransferase involved in cell wall biosynthesis
MVADGHPRVRQTVTARAREAARAVDVVVRVDRDPDALARCLDGLFLAANDTPFEVIVWASESDVADALRDAPRAARIAVVAPGEPLGRVLSRHRDRDVVLLAVEAEVQGDWLDRLALHAREMGVGVVGTLSNVGGAAAYPRPGAANALPAGETPATLDATAANVNAGRAVDVDAIGGPCLFVTRAVIDALGDVPVGDDEASIARALMSSAATARLRLCIAADVFVARRIEAGAAAQLPVPSPNPVLPLARRIDLARLAASPRSAIVFVSHGWGGGIRRYMNDLAALVATRADVLYLEPAGDDSVKLWWPRRGEAFAAWFRLPADMATLAAVLRGIGVARVHYHHVHGMPESILDLPRATGVAYDCTLHDYFAICPQYHLTDADGRYCGEPDRDGCGTCLAHRHAQWPLDIDAWRARFGEFLQRADRVIAPSRDVEARIHRYFPDLPILVWSHPEVAARLPPSPIRVVTLGNLSPEKGLHVVAACANDAKARGLPIVFHVLGAIARPVAQAPAVPLWIHGSYDDDALPALLTAEHADVLFFPAQVPETYSYTLSIALATGAPIVASALGALTERLAGRPGVRLLPFDAPPARWNDALLGAAHEASAAVSVTNFEATLDARA